MWLTGETARAYHDVFTLSYVTGRSVGIGAYLVRLGQRTIQMQVGPLILTGYGALNKLLGKEVYTSQVSIGLVLPRLFTLIERGSSFAGRQIMLTTRCLVGSAFLSRVAGPAGRAADHGAQRSGAPRCWRRSGLAGTHIRPCHYSVQTYPHVGGLLGPVAAALQLSIIRMFVGSAYRRAWRRSSSGSASFPPQATRPSPPCMRSPQTPSPARS